jgi:hypothetical protein
VRAGGLATAFRLRSPPRSQSAVASAARLPTQAAPVDKQKARLARRMAAARQHGVAHLCGCGLTEAPLQALGELHGVQVLNLSCNKLKRLPCELMALPSLAVLDASNNGLKAATFGHQDQQQEQQQEQQQQQQQQQAGTLAVLNLSFNKLADLPQDLGELLPLSPASLDCGVAGAPSAGAPAAGPAATSPLTPSPSRVLDARLPDASAWHCSCVHAAWPGLLAKACHPAECQGPRQPQPQLSRVVQCCAAQHCRQCCQAGAANPGCAGCAAGATCPSLQQLYLACNRLADLPASLAPLPLEDVFASDNPFGRVPPVLLRLGRLLKLSLAACELRELPDDLAGLSGVRWAGSGRRGRLPGGPPAASGDRAQAWQRLLAVWAEHKRPAGWGPWTASETITRQASPAPPPRKQVPGPELQPPRAPAGGHVVAAAAGGAGPEPHPAARIPQGAGHAYRPPGAQLGRDG